MTDAVLPIADVPAYQADALRSEARFTWNCWARQTGKSFTFALRRLLRGLLRKRDQIILSAGERQSREVMEKARQHCVALKVWHEWHDRGYFRGTRFRQLEIRLPGGLRIIGLPANPMTARGFSGDVFLDEFAMHRDDEAIAMLRGQGFHPRMRSTNCTSRSLRSRTFKSTGVMSSANWCAYATLE